MLLTTYDLRHAEISHKPPPTADHDGPAELVITTPYGHVTMGPDDDPTDWSAALVTLAARVSAAVLHSRVTRALDSAGRSPLLCSRHSHPGSIIVQPEQCESCAAVA